MKALGINQKGGYQMVINEKDKARIYKKLKERKEKLLKEKGILLTKSRSCEVQCVGCVGAA